MARSKIKENTANDVLVASRRICAFCFGLHHDTGIKPGQLAHVDQDSSNSSFENLAFLCFEHHDQYDSKTSQSKGLQRKELLTYRAALYVRNSEQSNLREPASGSQMALRRNHDREIFRNFEGWFDEMSYQRITWHLAYNEMKRDDISLLGYASEFRYRPSFRFLDEDLDHALRQFLHIVKLLSDFFPKNFWEPIQGQVSEYRKLLPSSWNNESEEEYMKRWNNANQLLGDLLIWFEASYCKFRWEVQDKLFI